MPHPHRPHRPRLDNLERRELPATGLGLESIRQPLDVLATAPVVNGPDRPGLIRSDSDGCGCSFCTWAARSLTDEFLTVNKPELEPPVMPGAPGGGEPGPLQPPGIPLPAYTTQANGLPILDSRPNAPVDIYLDFDGHGSDLPYDTNSDSTTFNASEQSDIVNCWRSISVYFAPYDVNVTTVFRSARPKAWQLISNSISGGYAYVGAFPNSSPRGFNQSSDARNRTSGIAHEVGHNLGLWHQSDYNLLGEKTNEYSSGDGNLRVPVMGVDFAGNVRKFIVGHPSNSPSNLQYDQTVITNEIKAYQPPGGDGYRADDFGNTFATATPLAAGDGLLGAWGIIERLDDVDMFQFTVPGPGGSYALRADPIRPSALDAKLELFDAAGVRLATVDANTNFQIVTAPLAGGTYFLAVSSHQSYGDIGTYSVVAQILPTGWDTRDIGSVAAVGYAGVGATAGSFFVGGSGADITGTADEFRYVYTPLTGDGSITARVTVVENTNGTAKSGVMIRDGLANNSKYAMLALTPNGNLVWSYRTTAGGSTTSSSTAGFTAPYWVRLTRAGTTLSAQASTNAVNWVAFGSVTMSLSATLNIGLAVTSRNDGVINDSEFSNVATTGSTGPIAPVYNSLPAPTGVTPTHSAGTGIALSWTAVAGATSYAVDRSSDGYNWSQIATPTGTTFDNTGLSGSFRYFYRVAARNGSSRSVPSEIVSLINRPSAVANLTATSWTQTQIILNWRDTDAETGYRVERSPEGTNWTAIATLAANVPSYTAGGLTAATTYHFRVIPLSPYGDGPASTVVRTTRLGNLNNLVINNITSNSMRLSWSAVASATGYQIERSTNGSSYSVLTNVTATTYTDTGLTPLGEYYYRVSATYLDTFSLTRPIKFAAAREAVPLPGSWQSGDIGGVGGPGAAGFNNGTFTAVASGSGISGTADSFRFVYQAITGDGIIVARVNAVENTNSSASGGVMIRESLTAGSRYSAVVVTRGNGLRHQTRTTTGNTPATTATASGSAPYWVRLTRTGNTVAGHRSTDGVAWTAIGTTTVTLGATAYFGLSLTAATNSQLNTSTFTDVYVSANTGTPRVQSVQVNDGSAQRSRVNGLTVTFSENVTLAAGAFALVRDGASPVSLTTTATSVVNGRRVATLGFSGLNFASGSLVDGNYRLTVNAAAVTDYNGTQLDGNGNGTAGDNFAFDFHRLFGDANGNSTVDFSDFLAFRTSFGLSSGAAGFLGYFDATNNGTVDFDDYLEFRARFGVEI